MRRTGGPVVRRRDVLKPCSRSRLRQPLARAAGPGGDHDAPPLAGPALGLRRASCSNTFDAARRRAWAKTGPGRPPASTPAAPSGLREGREGAAAGRRPASRPSRRGRGRGGPAAAGGTAPRRRAAPGAAGGVVVGDHLQPAPQHLLGLVVEADRGAGQVVEQRLHRVMEQRHPVLHAGMAPALGDRQVERVLRRAGAEQLAPAGAEAGDRCRRRASTSRDRPQRQALGAWRRCAGCAGSKRADRSRSCRRTGRAAPARPRRRGRGR